MFRALRKPTDGYVSRTFNRPISLLVSRFLVRTPITPNQISLGVMGFSLVAGWYVAMGDWLHLAIGGFLFHLASVLDGCDGEIARLKFTDSRLGEWMDTLADNVSYLAFFSGVVIGFYRVTDAPHVAVLGAAVFAGLLLSLSVLYLYLKSAGSGSMLSFIAAFSKEASETGRGRFHRLTNMLVPVVRRDFFAAFYFLLGLAGQLAWMFWLFVIATSWFSIAVLLTVGTLMRRRGVWRSQADEAAAKLVSGKAD